VGNDQRAPSRGPRGSKQAENPPAQPTVLALLLAEGNVEAGDGAGVSEPLLTQDLKGRV
jgi:hypothetical protein